MGGMAGMNPGNTNAMKFKTAEERKALCAVYCIHVEQGLSDESFPECDMQTLKHYREEYPLDFDTVEIEKSRRTRQLLWEKAGLDGTMGRIPGFNAATWKFNMANRFRWRDRSDVTSDEKPTLCLTSIIDAIEEVTRRNQSTPEI